MNVSLKQASYFKQLVQIAKQISQRLNTNRPLLLCKHGQTITGSHFLLDFLSSVSKDVAAKTVPDLHPQLKHILNHCGKMTSEKKK